MKSIISIAALLTLSLTAAAQTTPVAPAISNGQVNLTIQDSSGGSHAVTFPVTAVTTLSVGAGTDSYTPPVVVAPPPPPPPVAPTAPVIPSNAIAVNLLPLTNWKPCVHDAGTPGTASCSGSYPVSYSTYNNTRSFSMAYTGAGGVRWAISFAKDTTSTNFVYDTQVIAPDWSKVANLEMDTNKVLSSGKVAILGTQCSSYAKTWEVTFLTSTGSWHWVPTNVACNPTTWTPNVLHHIRIFGTISSTGVSTYSGVEFDGDYKPFTGATGNTTDALSWSAGTILTNLQVDGLGTSGSATIYAPRLTIYRW